MNFKSFFFCDCERKHSHTNVLSRDSFFIHPHFPKHTFHFYLNELLTELMNISVFFNESFNGPGRSNDILSGRRTCRKVEVKRPFVSLDSLVEIFMVVEVLKLLILSAFTLNTCLLKKTFIK